MADLAAVFHWQPSEMRLLRCSEAVEYRSLAVARFRLMRRLRGKRG